MNPSITLDGLNGAQRALVAYGGGSQESKLMNKAAVDEMLVPPSKVNAPKRSGRLADTIRSDSSPLYGYILAGISGSVEYAGVIHFGHATRGLGRTAKGSSVAARRRALVSAFEQDQATGTGRSGLGSRGIKKAARKNIGQVRGTASRNVQRGGPIRPQPFIYEAIEDKENAVMEFYERQLEQRARIEDLL